MAGQISTKLEVYEGGGALPDSVKGAVLAIGNFDGLHRGHRVLLDTVVERARAGGRKAAVMLFEPHPREYFHPQKPVFRLTTFEQKLALLESIGIDVVIQLPFDARLAEMPAETFVVDVLLGELAVSHIVVGYDFFFGKGRGGSPALLESIAKSRGVGVTVVEPVAEGGEVFSSSAVRGKIAEGDVKGAAEDLGYFWRISGTVVGGAKRGTGLGFPTANLALPRGCALAHGIYAVHVHLAGQRFEGAAYLGTRPTFDNGLPVLEVFLFDFSGDIYGRAIEVAFVEHIRPDRAFPDGDSLKVQIAADCAKARQILAAVGEGPLR
ncbi:MAG: bifunctional riboflavin kinase/FAD synthetase [Hyphomicrobiaceae bacterium]